MQRWLAGFETLTRLAFHASWIAAMVIGILHFHWLAAGVAFLLFLLRFTMQAVIVNKTARDLEEQRRYYFTLPASTYCSRYSLCVGNGTVCSARKAVF